MCYLHVCNRELSADRIERGSETLLSRQTVDSLTDNLSLCPLALCSVSLLSGFGLFHWLLLVVCGWANASDAIEILCVSFLLPTARCDLLLRSSDMGLLTASIFLGESRRVI